MIKGKTILINLNLSKEVNLYQLTSNDFDFEFSSKYHKLSESFLRMFQDEVYWTRVSEYQILSEDFIEEFKDSVNWYKISQYQKLSGPFIEKFQDKVDWINICAFQKLSEEFIEKFQDKIDWNCIHDNKKIKLSKQFFNYLYKSHQYELFDMLKEKKGSIQYAKLIESQIPRLFIEFE